jgi:putative RNA 2'-phosphotransferase
MLFCRSSNLDDPLTNMSRSSRYLSMVLRHAPQEIGLELDAAGWALVDDLLLKMKKAGRDMSRGELLDVVEHDAKRRFTLSADGSRIRAAQGHSIHVDLGLRPTKPPEFLFHGTARESLDAIFSTGLNPGARRQVHLSPDGETAAAVGRRHGKPVVLRVHAVEMHDAGHVFYQADNGVWLTELVPPEFLSFGM